VPLLTPTLQAAKTSRRRAAAATPCVMASRLDHRPSLRHAGEGAAALNGLSGSSVLKPGAVLRVED
jgi:hypothetical protein